MKTLKDLNLKTKRVILRCDFDDVFDGRGNLVDDFKIKKIIPTIQYLLFQNARIIIIAHGKNVFNEHRILTKKEISNIFNFQKIAENISKEIDRPVKFYKDLLSENLKKTVQAMQPKDVILLENLSLYPQEVENILPFAQQISLLGEAYINEAFSIACYQYATITHLPLLLPSCAGLLFEQELLELSKITLNPQRPLISVLGGSNLTARIGIIERLSSIADHLLIGGEIANFILSAKGITIGKSFRDPFLDAVASKIDLTNQKIHLPVDSIVSLSTIDNDYMHISAIGAIRKEEQCYDIGPESVLLFSEILKTAQTIFWSGSMGMFENDRFANGTREIAKAIAHSNGYKIASGRSTIAFLKLADLRDKISFVSLGELSAMKFVAGESIVGIDVLD
ncbi:MAG: phosphoglycerate kinase [Candidatus Paceibacterota bacterium]|jgi:phosphoglycerate kinase